MAHEELDLSIVLPALSEEKNLATLLPALKSAFNETGARYEIIVVDGPVAGQEQEALCRRNDVRHVCRTPSLDYVNAICSGAQASRGRRLLFMDSDGSHQVKDALSLWRNRDRGRVIIGSRYMSGGKSDNSLILLLMSWMVNVGFRLALNLKVKDVSNSLRLYYREDLAGKKWHSTNFEVIEEILMDIAMKHKSEEIVEVPVHFLLRRHGETKRNLWVFVLSYLVILFRLSKQRWGSSK